MCKKSKMLSPTILIKADILKDSFYKIDKKTRKNLYLFLWCISFLELIQLLLYPPSFENSLYPPSFGNSIHTVNFIILILTYITSIFGLIILGLKIKTYALLEELVKVIIFLFFLQVFPFLYILKYIISLEFKYAILDLVAFLGVMPRDGQQDFIYTFFSLSKLIITLWSLRYILRLRKWTLNRTRESS